jgi:hypothetical protein
MKTVAKVLTAALEFVVVVFVLVPLFFISDRVADYREHRV